MSFCFVFMTFPVLEMKMNGLLHKASFSGYPGKFSLRP